MNGLYAFILSMTSALLGFFLLVVAVLTSTELLAYIGALCLASAFGFVLVTPPPKVPPSALTRAV